MIVAFGAVELMRKRKKSKRNPSTSEVAELLVLFQANNRVGHWSFFMNREKIYLEGPAPEIMNGIVSCILLPNQTIFLHI